MSSKKRQCLVCNCEHSMTIDASTMAKALGQDDFKVHTQLCRAELGQLQQAMASGEPLLVACRQEEALFSEVAAGMEMQVDLRTADIRHSAGWSKDDPQTTPKMAALLAQALLPIPDVASISMESSGRCLILGHADHVVPAAERLGALMEVTALIDGGESLPSMRRDITWLKGRIRRLSGHLGQFTCSLEAVSMPEPSSRDRLRFEKARPELEAEFDCVIDLRGASPLVQAPEKRDGYMRADPSDLIAVERVLFDAVQLNGQFEKPRYVNYDHSLCAHSRSGKVGCHRCLDHCPTGAITPNGDHVSIDPFVCAGCGSCAALCPSGAIQYANPSPNHLLDRMRTLLSSFSNAGGVGASLLVHDNRHGEAMIEAMARYGDGLPENVIPLAIEEVTQLSLEVITSAFAYGAIGMDMILPSKDAAEALAIDANIGFANAILKGLGYGEDRARMIFVDDPDVLSEQLWGRSLNGHECAASYLSLGGKRERLRLSLDALHSAAKMPVDILSMPDAAPLGNIEIDVDGCTLCLACVGACPTGALIDNPDAPMLRFLEDACIQCGLCQNTCPEKVIKLQPRVNFLSEAKSPRLIKQEEPAECSRCGRAFGVKSSVERIVTALAAKHSMFQSDEQIARLRMCEDCRVVVQFEAKDNPFQAGPRPKTKTTDDYLREREEIEEARRKLDPKA